MRIQLDFDGSSLDDQWAVDSDPLMGSDAMRWRPESARRPRPPRPMPVLVDKEVSSAEANALWLAVGAAYRGLTDA